MVISVEEAFVHVSNKKGGLKYENTIVKICSLFSLLTYKLFIGRWLN